MKESMNQDLKDVPPPSPVGKQGICYLGGLEIRRDVSISVIRLDRKAERLRSKMGGVDGFGKVSGYEPKCSLQTPHQGPTCARDTPSEKALDARVRRRRIHRQGSLTVRVQSKRVCARVVTRDGLNARVLSKEESSQVVTSVFVVKKKWKLHARRTTTTRCQDVTWCWTMGELEYLERSVSSRLAGAQGQDSVKIPMVHGCSSEDYRRVDTKVVCISCRRGGVL
uniref:Uncharacterized protein n=1 Tax=Peronospora matthiolae TaxID=2874970 RepID=A0AAV1VBD4_9STRA